MPFSANPALQKLGFSATERVVILHTDDIGMCQASLAAFAGLLDFGLISSGAVMVPCPWFPAVATLCRAHPQADIGVHLTLTSEWEGYRWGPLSTRDPASGLLDADGYFPRRSEEVQRSADPGAALTELRAQVARALAAGIDVTHVDTHMGSVGDVRLVPAYLQVALENRLPLMLPRYDEARWLEEGLDAETAKLGVQLVHQLEELGMPLLDQETGLPLDVLGNRVEQAKRALDALPAGLTHFVIHPAQDSPELRAITPDWRCRVGDYEAFTSEELSNYIRRSGIQVIGYRALRDLIRAV